MTETTVKEELEEWLRNNSFDAPIETLRPHVAFPSDETLNLYLQDVDERSEVEVIDLLWRMLVASTAVADTEVFYLTSPLLEKRARDMDADEGQRLLNSGSRKRIRWRERTGIGEAWEGMTWALEMLPFRPGSAIDALNLYLLAQHGLPDERIHAVSDAIDVIRARWIGSPKTTSGRVELLKHIDPRKFEALVAALWREMSYDVVLTPASRDGGFDVHATKQFLGREESILIECKRYIDKKISIDIIQRLNGIGDPNLDYSRRVLVTTSSFTKPAEREARTNRRTALIDGLALVPMLNEYLGFDWPKRLERIVRSILDEHFANMSR